MKKVLFIVFYSPGSQEINIKKDYIPEPKYALALFPSEQKNKYYSQNL
jgi:hypothetical protein